MEPPIEPASENMLDQNVVIAPVVGISHARRDVLVHRFADREHPVGCRVYADDWDRAGFGNAFDRPIEHLIGAIAGNEVAPK